jgi:hypothetical protein
MKFGFIAAIILFCANISWAQIHSDNSLAAQRLVFAEPAMPNIRIDLTMPVTGRQADIAMSHKDRKINPVLLGAALSIIGPLVTVGSTYDLVTAPNQHDRETAANGIWAGAVATGLGALILYCSYHRDIRRGRR